MGKVALVIVLLVLILLFVLMPGKSNAPSPDAPTVGAASAKPFKVALVTPGAITDGGWSQSAYDGLKKIRDDLGATISNKVAGSSTEAFAAFGAFAGEGNDLIIGHAGEWFDPKTLEIATANPKSVILISGSEKSEGNVVGARYLLEDATYVLGQIAGSMSKSGILGCVGPKELPVIESTFYAFEMGAKSVKPDIRVEVVWTNEWADVARAKERTLILIGKGADFILHNCNDGAPGVFQAIQEKRKQGADVYAFGSNADQTAMAEDAILASAVLDISAAMLNVAKKMKDGSFERKAQFLGLPDGLVWVAYNKKLEDKVPAAVRQLADETVEKIKKKQLQVPRRILK